MAALPKVSPPAANVSRANPAIHPDTPAPSGWRWASQDMVQPGMARLVKIGIAGHEERYYRLDRNVSPAESERVLPNRPARAAEPEGKKHNGKNS